MKYTYNIGSFEIESKTPFAALQEAIEIATKIHQPILRQKFNDEGDLIKTDVFIGDAMIGYEYAKANCPEYIKIY